MISINLLSLIAVLTITARSYAVEYWSFVGRPFEFLKLVSRAPAVLAISLIILTNFSSEPATLSAKATLASFPEFKSSALSRSSVK